MKRRDPPLVHWLDTDGKYLCIKAFGKANPAKASNNRRKITCKRCRRMMNFLEVPLPIFIFR